MPLIQRTYRSPPPTPSPEKDLAKLSLNVTEPTPDVRDHETADTIPKPPEPAAQATNTIHSDSPDPNPPSTSTPSTPLRQNLIGTWKLESYTTYPTPTSTIQRPTFPMTKSVTGLIMYTPDGYVSAQMLIPGQKSFARGEAEEAQWAEAAKRCFSYCGPYYVSDEGPGRKEVLRHTFQFCSLPGWVGDVQVRTHRFEEEGEVLVLGSEEVMEIKGDKRIPVLKWRRARENSGGVPPPPTPKIKISGPEEP